MRGRQLQSGCQGRSSNCCIDGYTATLTGITSACVAIRRDATGCLAGISIGGRKIQVENASNLTVTCPAVCHLIATGPSVNEIDYGALDLHHVMGVNGAISLRDRHDVSFEFYCIVDAGFVRKRPDLVARVIQEDLLLFTTPLVRWYIARYFPLDQIRCRIFLIEDVLYPACKRSLRQRDLLGVQANSDAVLFDETAPLGFSMNLKRGVTDGRTVAYTALQVLVWLGFDKAFLQGLDLLDATHIHPVSTKRPTACNPVRSMLNSTRSSNLRFAARRRLQQTADSIQSRALFPIAHLVLQRQRDETEWRTERNLMRPRATCQ